MTAFIGTAGDDNLVGTSGDDTFNVIQGGNDTVQGNDGNDTINFGATFTAADAVDGGTGSDQLILGGDYSHNTTFAATTLVNVEKIVLRAGNSYFFTTVDANVAAGATMIVNGGALGAGDSLAFSGAAETDGAFHFIGGAGADRLVGSTNADFFDLSKGGEDSVQGGQGNDIINMAGTLDAGDRIAGGNGNDTVEVSGSTNVIFGANTMVSVERILATGSTDVDLTTNNNTVVGGGTLTVNATGMTGGNFNFDGGKELDGSFIVTTGDRNGDITVGAGNDTITTGAGTHVINLSNGGEDTFIGGSGNDTVVFGATLSDGDSVSGGGGVDVIQLSGDYSAGLTLTGANPLTGIGALKLIGGGVFNINLGHSSINSINALNSGQMILDGSEMTGQSAVRGGDDNDTFITAFSASTFAGGAGDDTLVLTDTTGTTPIHFAGGDGYDTLVINRDYDISHLSDVEQLDLMAGQNYTITAIRGHTPNFGLLIDGHLLGASDHLTELPADESGLSFLTVIGGAGSDTLYGDGSTLTGGGGADTLNAGFGEPLRDFDPVYEGADKLVYNAVSNSTSTAYDTVVHFDPSADKFQLPSAVSAVDASVTAGALSTASFDSDLAAAVGSLQLGTGHAVLFTPDSGTLSGDHFLVIDANGTAGYQAGQDYVILISDAASLTFTTANFTT